MGDGLPPGSFVSFVPMGHLLVPLIIWLMKRDEYDLVADQGREALNFQLNATLWLVVCALLCFVLVGIPMLVLLAVVIPVLSIIAAVKAHGAERYRYPGIIRFF